MPLEEFPSFQSTSSSRGVGFTGMSKNPFCDHCKHLSLRNYGGWRSPFCREKGKKTLFLSCWQKKSPEVLPLKHQTLQPPTPGLIFTCWKLKLQLWIAQVFILDEFPTPQEHKPYTQRAPSPQDHTPERHHEPLTSVQQGHSIHSLGQQILHNYPIKKQQATS